MKMKQVTLGKELKLGMPNYSNASASMYVVWDVEENEKFNYDEAWDIINQELIGQTGDQDPFWMKSESKNYYKVTVKIPKGVNTK